MNLYVVRHGIAADAAPGGGGDMERPLTREGHRKTRKAALGLAALGCAPDAILSSPLRRARETADILADVLPGSAAVAVCPDLSPGGDPAAVLTEARGMQATNLLVVGHMPDLSDLTAFALQGRGTVHLAFGKAGAALLSFDGAASPGRAFLAWLLPPRALRALADKA